MAQTVEAKQVVLKDSEGGYLLPYAGVAQKALKAVSYTHLTLPTIA